MKTNEQLQLDVLETLKWEPLLDIAEIGVTAKDGVVTLTGVVDSYPKKLAAERAAKSVFGVRAVAQEVEVHPQGSGMKTDTDIAAAALTALQWYSSVPDDKLKVSVTKGWVKLEGEVDWEYQKEDAVRAVEFLLGVRGVSNLITVKPKVKPSDIKRKIHRAFERSATVDSSQVGVDVNGSIVRLHGEVRSWAERADAENAAWSAPGVTEVKDELIIRDFTQA